MADRVLVTGISGFVGGHVALQLLKAGYAVRGSIRNMGRADTVRQTLARHGADVSDLEIVSLDLLADAGWADAMADVRYLQHVASPFVTTMPRDKEELIRPAVDGATRALEAAFAAKVERVVLTSSLAAIMYGAHDRSRPFTAEDWTMLGPGTNPYIESKTKAEQTAWEIAGRLGRTGDLVAINPGGIYGPLLDEDAGTTVALVVRLLSGKLPGVARIHLPSVDVRDIAALHVAAMTSPDAGGRRYPAVAGSISLLEMANTLRQHLPQLAHKLPRFEAPDWLVRLFAFVDADMRGNIAELGPIRHVDASAAEALLGRPFISVQDAVVASGHSAVEHKLV